MTAGNKSPAISRRDALKYVGAIGGVAAVTAVIPVSVKAKGAATGQAFGSPVAATRVQSSSALANDYLTALRAIPGHAAATLPPNLYALTCTTRSAMPFYGLNFTANAYWDAAGTSGDNPPPVGPTLTFQRGTSTGVWLQNTMSGCGPNNNMPMSDPKSAYTPHGYITTNLHTHGLHVSPNAPSDDVLLMIASSNDDQNPPNHTTVFPYLYEVPATHPVGTFWYHPHKHGSVSSQMATGMAGALIVRSQGGDDQDFDDLLASQCNISVDDEVVLVLQTINYFPAGGSAAAFDSDAYYNGSSSPAPGASCFNIDVTAGTSKTSVNGLVQPTLSMKQGEIKRFRIVNATIGQVFVPMFAAAPQAGGPTPKAPDVYAIATDGIALAPPYPNLAGKLKDTDPYFRIDYGLTASADPIAYWTTAELITVAPGQRVDLLVRANDSGSFTFAGAKWGDAPTVVQGAGPNPNTTVVNTDPLLTLTVSTDSRSDQSLPTLALFKSSEIQRPTSMMLNGATVPPATQTLEFKTVDSAFAAGKPPFLINDQHFDMTAPEAQLQLYLNDTDVWNLYSTNDAHIFHIHINSFQAFARVPYDVKTRSYGAPVFYQLPIWRDTVYFDSTVIQNNVYVPGTMLLATSTQLDFTGEFVLHCHNLFHEDLGMMLTVSIQDPGTIQEGAGKPVNLGKPVPMRTPGKG